MTTDPFVFNADPGLFAADQLDDIVSFVDEHGFARIRGVYGADTLDALQADMEHWQAELLAGHLDDRHGTVILDDPDAMVDGEPFAHYVTEVTRLSALGHECAHAPVIVDAISRLLGPGAWLLDDDRFGVVYQDARPGLHSGYSRIGWHSDWQSGPHLPVWPSVAFTIHLDATSPANGFLRVVPGSQRHDPAGMPPAFEKVPGEIAVYCERGDVLLHHSNLWHSAARATEDPPLGVRRHLRGGWYAGERLEPGHGVEDFVKNAAR